MDQKQRTAFQKIYHAVGFGEIAPENLQPDAANRLRRTQIRGAIEQMRVFVVGNTFFAPVLSFQAWGNGVNGLVLCWTGLMLIFSWWLFWAWRTSYETDGKASDMTRFVNETRVNASIWCFGMVLFFPLVDGGSKTILTCVMVGSLALGTVGFSQAPKAAFSYLAVQSATLICVPTLTGIAAGSFHDLLLGTLAVVVSAAVFNATLERAKDQMRAFRDHEALAHKTEVVDLLLKDYEEQGHEWIWRTDPDGRLTSCPRQILDLLAVDEQALHQTDLIDAIKDQVEPAGRTEIGKIRRAFEAKIDLNDITLPLMHNATRKTKWIIMKGRPQFESGEFAGYRGLFADASATVEANKHIEFLATHDPLTKTKNRNYVQTKLEALDPKQHKALVFLIDLDGFKQVNDGYGHSVGDMLLQVVAQRLQAIIPDTAIVARLGGDEFLVFVQLDASEMLYVHEAFANEILKSLSKPFVIDHLDIGLSGSVGIAKFPRDTENGLTLLNQADLALYAAKRGGRNKCVTFVEKMLDGFQKRIIITERLRKALVETDVIPYYQAQFCAQTGKLVGAEALARWTDTELGVVGPDVFIPSQKKPVSSMILVRICCDAPVWTRSIGPLQQMAPPSCWR